MNEIKLEYEDLMVCRICLQTSEDGMISIYEKNDNSALCVYQRIEKYGGIKIIKEPGLPSHICKECNIFLDIAMKFQIICRDSDEYLREFACEGTKLECEDDGVEYLMEYAPEEFVREKEVLVQDCQIIDSVASPIAYEEVDDLNEMWLNEEAFENNIIVEEHGTDSAVTSTPEASPTPAKTLDISSDGAAVIRVKPQKKLKVQMVKEKTPHICDICGNSYPRKYAFDAHMRRHRNERPFECEICHQSFHLNFQLTRHIQKHTGARPYKCQYCQRSFADRSTMIKHERIHRNERPYTCETCGKSFTYSSVLKVHMLTHTGEKPFTCGICNKRFARAHHLRAHLETLLHQNDPRSSILLKRIKREEDLDKNVQDDYYFRPIPKRSNSTGEENN